MQPGNDQDPLLRQVLPLKQEFVDTPGFSAKIPCKNRQSAQAGILHKYQARVLLIVQRRLRRELPLLFPSTLSLW